MPDNKVLIPLNQSELSQEILPYVEKFIPAASEKVDKIFRKQGAYSRYKDFLESKGMLQKWYDFEEKQGQSTLLQWCEENGIDITD